MAHIWKDPRPLFAYGLEEIQHIFEGELFIIRNKPQGNDFHALNESLEFFLQLI
jgi:hypothetical protein